VDVEIDWEKVALATLSCRCGAEFRGQAKPVYGGPSRGIVSRDPCPECGQTNGVVGVRGDPETMTL
jgi:hypothetical protein